VMAKSNQGCGGLHSNERSILERCTHKIPHSAEAGLETTIGKLELGKTREMRCPIP